MPAAVGEATVLVDGRPIGTIREQVATSRFQGLDGEYHVGKRWLPSPALVLGEPSDRFRFDPDKYPADQPGPVTRNEAALLLLALTNHDPAASAKAIGYKIGAPA